MGFIKIIGNVSNLIFLIQKKVVPLYPEIKHILYAFFNAGAVWF